MKLTKDIVQISKRSASPLLIVDLELLRKKYRKIQRSIKNLEIFYAMKANDHPVILKALKTEGSGFEISSLNELKSLQKLNVKSEKIICMHPIKSQEFLRELNSYGVNILAFDSKDEVDKIAHYAPNSKGVLRINVPNEGSDWPLTRKFGIDVAEAFPLMEYARSKNVSPIGLTFHVGSQCLNKHSWTNALYICDDIWMEAINKGFEMSFLSLGGGIPIDHGKKFPNIAQIGRDINTKIAKSFVGNNAFRVTIEPGRGLIGDSAILASRVVGKAQRGSEEWIYLDVGVFNGLMETIERFDYELRVHPRRREVKKVTIAGPSCDSVDIMFEGKSLPSVEIGDLVYILNAGAYTTVYAANFNGFNIPTVHFLNK